MSVVPTGSPAWERANDHSVYGGHNDKTNYQSIGVVNPQTDVGAAALCRIAADLEAVQRTASFCILTALCSDSSPAAPTIEIVNQMTGMRLVSYLGSAAPVGFPSAVRNGNGDVTFKWAASYNDPYGVAGSVNIVHATAQIHGSTAGDATVEISDSDADLLNDSVRVRVTNAAGTAISNPRFTLEVWTGV